MSKRSPRRIAQSQGAKKDPRKRASREPVGERGLREAELEKKARKDAANDRWRESKVTVTRRAKIGPVLILEDTGETTVMDVHRFPVTPAFIEIDAKATKNVIVGRASSFISVGIKASIPVYAEEMEYVTPALGLWVSEAVEVQLEPLERLVKNEAAGSKYQGGHNGGYG